MRLTMLTVLAAPLVLMAANSQQPAKPGGIHFYTKSAESRLGMVSCIRNGVVFYATEVPTNSGGRAGYCQLDGNGEFPPGAYDIRIEGEGIVTEMKRGVLVTPGNTTVVTLEVKAGKGVHIVEYATGSVPREEVAVRLQALEVAVSKLTAALEGMKKAM